MKRKLPQKPEQPEKQQLGIRIDSALVIEAKVLAARQRRRLNDVVDEALRDLLEKHSSSK